MIQLLRQYPWVHPCLHQVVFCPGSLDFWVANAADPRKINNAGAQNQPFYRFNLAKLLAGEPPARHLLVDTKDRPILTGKVAFKPVGDQKDVPERYRLAAHEFPFEMQLKHELAEQGFRIFDLRFPSAVESPFAENNIVYAEYYVPKDAKDVPGVVLLDILQGNLAVTRAQAALLAQNGIASMCMHMPYYGPRRPRSVPVRMIMPNVEHSLEAIRQTVLDVRRAGAWLESRPEIDAKRLGIMGTSLGSFMGSLAAEMEPRFNRVVILLGGGNLVEAFYDHPNAAPLRKTYEALGGSKEKFAAQIACADPITCAANLKGRKVLMFGAKRDEIVPPKSTQALWEAAGKPQIIWYDCSHVGAALYFVQAMEHIVPHFRSP
jgi:dienelactone hydrolase